MLGLMLLPAATAAAKEPVAATVCGPSDCTTVKDRETLFAIGGDGGPGQPPERGAPWYPVRMIIKIDRGRHDSFALAIVPSTGMTRYSDGEGGYSWVAASPRAKRAYRRITRGLEAFPANTLEGVGPMKARVDEVILPPKQEPAAATDGGSSPVPWIAGGVVVMLGLAGVFLRRHGLPWPKPAEG